MSKLENVLAMDSRLQKLEAAIQERVADDKPWWRDAKTVTVLGALIAAVLPLLKFIDDYSRNSRDNRRQVIELQEKIRQTYLEKVLNPGSTPAEKQQIFGLLKELSADTEMQKWANKEFDLNEALIKNSEKQRDEALTEKAHLCAELLAGTAGSVEQGKLYGLDTKIMSLGNKLSISSPKPGCVF